MIDTKYLEQLIIKQMLCDKHYAVVVSNSFDTDYFDLKETQACFTFISNYLREYNKLPQKEIIEHSLNNIAEHLEEIDDISLDLVANADWLLTETNTYLKNKAITKAILSSVNIIESGADLSKIRTDIETALIKDLKVDLGLNYWSDLGTRLIHILNTNDARITSGYPTLDEYINLGFPKRGLLCALLGGTFSGKSQFAINFATRQTLAGFNTVIFTFEMDEYAYAMRADGIYSGLEVNKLYTSKESVAALLKELKPVKSHTELGSLIIKDYPSGTATVNDLIIFIRELQMRGINPDIVYVDYIGIMKGRYKEQSYLNIKELAEELRAFASMFDFPVMTFHQLNREGRRVSFKELSGIYAAESSALEHTADFMAIIGIDEDKIVYENTMYLKIVKNRLGGRKAEIPFYVDFNSLKIYDESEMDTWINAARKSGDERKLWERN